MALAWLPSHVQPPPPPPPHTHTQPSTMHPPFAFVFSALPAFVALPSCSAFVPIHYTPHHQRSSSAATVAAISRSHSHLQAERTATFGMGCFWKPSETMLSVPGVISTVAGYTGKADAFAAPSYNDVCYSRDWVEAVRVTYDDEIISYSQLLDEFFEAQEAKPGSRQYASIIFPNDDQQAAEAKSWLETARQQKRMSKGIPALATTIEPATKFYKAEGYHQEFWPKNRPRFAVGFVLLAIASGALNGVLPDPNIADKVETLANGAFLVGALAMQAERWIDKEVVEM